MHRTLESVMMRRAIPPALWVVVMTGPPTRRLDSAEQLRPYALPAHRSSRGSWRRNVGPGVIEAFMSGLETVALEDFDYICKLDLDLDLPPRYFEILIERVKTTRRLARRREALLRRSAHRESDCGGLRRRDAVGMTKLYRVQCFRIRWIRSSRSCGTELTAIAVACSVGLQKA